MMLKIKLAIIGLICATTKSMPVDARSTCNGELMLEFRSSEPRSFSPSVTIIPDDQNSDVASYDQLRDELSSAPAGNRDLDHITQQIKKYF